MDKKISELQESLPIDGTESIVNQKGTDNFKNTYTQLKDWILTFVNNAVTSVNSETGDVVLDGTDIELIESGGVSVTQAISDIETQIDGKVSSVQAGSNVEVNNADPINPIVSAFPTTTAGLLDRTYFTGDTETLTAGTFYKSNRDSKGTVATVTQTVTVNDNQKAYFAQDVIGDPYPIDTTIYKGSYSGIFNGLVDDNGGEQKFYVEIYKTDVDGTPVASGITGAPIGDLGVTVIAIAESGLIDLQKDNETQFSVTAELTENLSLLTTNRVRYHVAAEKVGTAGGSKDISISYGFDHVCHLDIPVQTLTSTVINSDPTEFPSSATQYDINRNIKSNVDTNTTALDNLDTEDVTNNDTLNFPTEQNQSEINIALKNQIDGGDKTYGIRVNTTNAAKWGFDVSSSNFRPSTIEVGFIFEENLSEYQAILGGDGEYQTMFANQLNDDRLFDAANANTEILIDGAPCTDLNTEFPSLPSGVNKSSLIDGEIHIIKMTKAGLVGTGKGLQYIASHLTNPARQLGGIITSLKIDGNEYVFSGSGNSITSDVLRDLELESGTAEWVEISQEAPQSREALNIILAGQSNAIGRNSETAGQPVDLPNDGALSFCNYFATDNTFKPYTLNMNYQGDNTGGWGVEYRLSKLITDNSNYSINLLKYALGGSQIGGGGDWSYPSGSLTTGLINTVNTSGVNYDVMVWIQGENDSTSQALADAYYDNLKGFIDYVRSQINRNMLFVIVRLYDFPDAGVSPYLPTSQQAQDEVRRDVYEVIEIHPQENASLKGDNIHYDATGIDNLAKEVYKSLKRYI